jgi:hypothetical protein
LETAYLILQQDGDDVDVDDDDDDNVGHHNVMFSILSRVCATKRNSTQRG